MEACKKENFDNVFPDCFCKCTKLYTEIPRNFLSHELYIRFTQSFLFKTLFLICSADKQKELWSMAKLARYRLLGPKAVRNLLKFWNQVHHPNNATNAKIMLNRMWCWVGCEFKDKLFHSETRNMETSDLWMQHQQISFVICCYFWLSFLCCRFFCRAIFHCSLLSVALPKKEFHLLSK